MNVWKKENLNKEKNKHTEIKNNKKKNKKRRTNEKKRKGK